MNPYLPSLSDFAEPWHTDAACRSHPNPDLWHPAPTDHDAAWLAKRICGGCPVREACLQAALDREGATVASTREGIWGGLNGTERATRARAGTKRPPRRKDYCLRGHDRKIHGRPDRTGKVNCHACASELTALQSKAMRITGLSQRAYRARYGSGREAAEAIITQHERTDS